MDLQQHFFNLTHGDLFTGNDIRVYTKRHKALKVNDKVDLKGSSQINKVSDFRQDAGEHQNCLSLVLRASYKPAITILLAIANRPETQLMLQ